MDLTINGQKYRICVFDSIYINRIGDKDCKILKEQFKKTTKITKRLLTKE